MSRLETSTSAATARPNEDLLLKVASILNLLDISHATWWRWVKANPELLKPIRLGRNTTRWRTSAVKAFIEQAEKGGAKAHAVQGGADG
jgi:predicted DNA-binding transcriptional regulator AlpA